VADGVKGRNSSAHTEGAAKQSRHSIHFFFFASCPELSSVLSVALEQCQAVSHARRTCMRGHLVLASTHRCVVLLEKYTDGPACHLVGVTEYRWCAVLSEKCTDGPACHPVGATEYRWCAVLSKKCTDV
jgi:hypothetical protein